MAAIILMALVLQTTLFARFSFEGARPEVLVLVALMAGFVAGPEDGAIVGFATGLALDVVVSTPFGLTALVYTVAGYAAGSITSSVLRSAWWIASLVGAAGSAAVMLVYALVGAVLGEPTLSGPSLATIVVVVSAVNAALAPLATMALRWARTDDVDRGRHAFLSR
ncbi:MAG: rod shape-determining protein MreD [Aquihabitans sp.]